MIKEVIRQFRFATSFSFAVVIAVALGVGASAGVLGVVNAVLFTRLSVPHARGLFSAGIVTPGALVDRFSYPDILAINGNLPPNRIGVAASDIVSVESGGHSTGPRHLHVQFVSEHILGGMPGFFCTS